MHHLILSPAVVADMTLMLLISEPQLLGYTCELKMQHIVTLDYCALYEYSYLLTSYSKMEVDRSFCCFFL